MKKNSKEYRRGFFEAKRQVVPILKSGAEGIRERVDKRGTEEAELFATERILLPIVRSMEPEPLPRRKK